MNPISTILLILSITAPLNGEASNGNYRFIRKIYDQCVTEEETFKCFKIQALKVVNKALNSKSINITDGVSLISEANSGRSFHYPEVHFNETKLEKLDSQEIDGLLVNATSRFLNNHKLEVSVPRLIEEGRKKKNKGGQNGALMWALAIKGSFLAMAYNGIAVMAGTALIVGKMALLLSAILGLKKLVSGGQEKTTFEIVKHPKYAESHSHSTSYEEEGHYGRSFGSGEQFGVRSRSHRS